MWMTIRPEEARMLLILLFPLLTSRSCETTLLSFLRHDFLYAEGILTIFINLTLSLMPRHIDSLFQANTAYRMRLFDTLLLPHGLGL